MHKLQILSSVTRPPKDTTVLYLEKGCTVPDLRQHLEKDHNFGMMVLQRVFSSMTGEVNSVVT